MKKIVSVFLLLSVAAGLVFVSPVSAEGTESFTDPADSYVHTDAEYEDAGISLWFDYASEKVSSAALESTGRESATVYMAKNEIEDAQFVLYSAEGRENLSAELGGFSDGNANTLSADIYIELYHDCGDSGLVPDAIPPLSAYGAFSLEAGKSQAFLVKVTSAADTPAGLYSSSLIIRDGENRAVKQTEIYVKVWDFALSEETACATSVNLDYGYLSNAYSGTGADFHTIYKNYYDYLLENRVCAYYLPYDLYTAEAIAYMDNPRVTSFQGDYSYQGVKYQSTFMPRIYKAAYTSAENGNRFNKAYYFSNVVDASTPADLERLRAYYDGLSTLLASRKPSYAEQPLWFITTYINDIDYTKQDGTVIDQIDYYGDFVNLWCSKTFAYTDVSELGVTGAKVMQPLKWNSVYGTFGERMAEKRENGQKVWWFISWDVEAPYINYYMQTDGVAQRVLFWQQYDNGVQGFLYNFANFWIGDCSDPYNNNITNASYPDAHGESILLYPGSTYGLEVPVGSLRLEAMRDGIEDYQMFSMLEAALGDGACDEYIDRMTTGMVRYSVSDAEYYSARVALGNALEAALSAANCEHTYICEVTAEATCTEDGSAVYTCEKCGDTYTETLPAAGHSFTLGKCSVCGEADPNAVSLVLDGVSASYSAGDTVTLKAEFYTDGQNGYRFAYWSGDTDVITDTTAAEITFTMPEKDVTLTKNYVTVGDANGDGRVNGTDTNYMKRTLTGSLTEASAMDINLDGRVNGTDANLLKRILVGSYVPEK